MKYKIFIAPNQRGEVSTLLGERGEWDKVVEDFDPSLNNKRLLKPVSSALRETTKNVVRVNMTKEDAQQLLTLLGLSY